MNRNYLLFTLLLFFIGIDRNYAQNTITLTPNINGTEGNTVFTDASTIVISSSGAASYYNSNSSDDWSVAATTITQSGALNKTFDITWGGMASVITSGGDNYGKMLTAGGIDRSSSGQLGIRNGTNAGIDPGEGYFFGLNLSNLAVTAGVQITKISVAYLNASNETGIIVNRKNTSKRIVFGNAGAPGINFTLSSGAGDVDVSSLGLYIGGGSVDDEIVSIFNNSAVASDWRITKIELKVLTNIFNAAVITNTAHPRLLLKENEEAAIQTLISQSPEYHSVHSYIIEQANTFLTAPVLVYNPNISNRILETSREAITRIFYLSYAFRMTNNTAYRVKAEEVINTVCDFPNWVTYSLDVAEMCFAVSIGYDWLYDGLSTATKQKAREKILNYAFLTQKTAAFWDYTSNWNSVCIGGLTMGALAILGDGTTQMDDEAKYIINRVLIKNPNALNAYANGNYPEGPMYWSYGTTYQVLLLSGLEKIYGVNHEGINRLIYTPGFLESAKFMQYASGTSSLFFNYSDGTDKRVPLPATMWMAKKLNNPSILSIEKELLENGKYASNYSEDARFLPLALIYGKDISITNLTPPLQKLWYGYGEQPVAMVRTDWQGPNGKFFGVKGGTPNYSHAHMDGGTFVYDAQGLRWATDFGKEDYEAIKANISPPGAQNDFSQNSNRWNVFRTSNISHNTLSIKRTTESIWQHHKVNGKATISETYDTNAKRGAKINLLSLIGLNNEVDAIDRSIYLVNGSYLEIKDYIDNGAEAINLYWNMATTANVTVLNATQLKLTQGGKTIVLEVVCSNPAVTFTLASNRSADPVSYFPSATYERKNPNASMVGFEATIPANEVVTFTVTLKDDAVVPPSTTEAVNYVLLELPAPVTGLEANNLYYDTSEFHVNEAGEINIGGTSTEYAWNVYGNTNFSEVFGKKFLFRWSGMASTNLSSGSNYGAMLAPAGIDRSSIGELGIRGLNGDINISANGIDVNEGYQVGFDASKLPSNFVLQLAKVGLSLVSGSKKGIIVNRTATSKTKTFGGSSSSGVDYKFPSNGLGFVDVENLDIKIQGGHSNYNLASIFNIGTGTENIRINKFVFKIVLDETTLALPLTSEANILKEIGKELTVYPNPFKDHITLQNIVDRKENIQIKVFSLSGHCVFNNSYPLNAKINQVKLDLQKVSPGTYLIQITDRTGVVATKKIIKQ
ncbi:T9SS type A sorting domain-containing protein [Pedobacter nanyangensis]|uniref:T9SS type A sorting domain-containing protein n=1 Tax=Pedobacter nanyangensis TaxID=1562389 RepID=UPI000DE4EBDE|nr:T9SS type A sorting domain-containing protein [Pedobacter nanyangensis]